MRNHKSLFGIFNPVASSNNMYTDMLNNIFLKLNSSLLGMKRHTASKGLIYSLKIGDICSLIHLFVFIPVYSFMYPMGNAIHLSIVFWSPCLLYLSGLHTKIPSWRKSGMSTTSGSQSRCNINTPSNKDYIILPLSKIFVS